MPNPRAPGAAPPRVERIVVAYDGSEPSVRAAQFALRFMASEGAEIWVVHATDPPRTVAEPRTEEEQGSESAAIAQSLRAFQSSADPSGKRLHVWVREGRAAQVVIEAAAEVRADLIVVGTRGLRGASRLLLGSVSTEVLTHSNRPVTVVP
jgi:nucleotide-binding universal stress UspA family protein